MKNTKLYKRSEFYLFEVELCGDVDEHVIPRFCGVPHREISYDRSGHDNVCFGTETWQKMGISFIGMSVFSSYILTDNFVEPLSDSFTLGYDI